MDTVRADRLGCYGYTVNPTTPNLDELAAQSLLFLDASATAGWTKPSVPSFFTGTYPAQHGVYEGSARGIGGKLTDVLPDAALTLAEVFEANGYRTGAFIHNEHLRRGNGFEQGFHRYVDDAGDARDIRWQATDWLGEQDGGRPFFLYLHFLDAHYPYPIPKKYARMFNREGDIELFKSPAWRKVRDAVNHGQYELSNEELTSLKLLYDGAIRYIDDQLGLLCKELQRHNLWENTIVCVLADHGEEFMEHGRIGHGHGLYENLLRVPWILRLPGHPPARHSGQVSLVDLFPTLVAAAGLDVASETVGVNRLAEPDTVRPIFAEHKQGNAYVQSYRVGSAKLLRCIAPPSGSVRVLPLTDFVELGTRWEIRVVASPDGSLKASRLKPKHDPDQPLTELKDVVRYLGDSTMSLAGLPLRFLPTTEFYGDGSVEGAGRSSLQVGAPAKAVGRFGDDGVFVAQRVKLYPRHKKVEPLLRGRIYEVDGTAAQGRISLDGIEILIDENTEWLFEDSDISEERMQREQITQMLKLGPKESEAAGFKIETHFYDLDSDPGEHQPLRAHCAPDRLALELEHHCRSIVDLRFYDTADKILLTSESVQKLRALGYVD